MERPVEEINGPCPVLLTLHELYIDRLYSSPHFDSEWLELLADMERLLTNQNTMVKYIEQITDVQWHHIEVIADVQKQRLDTLRKFIQQKTINPKRYWSIVKALRDFEKETTDITNFIDTDQADQGPTNENKPSASRSK